MAEEMTNNKEDSKVIGKVLFTQEQITERAKEIAAQIDKDFEGEEVANMHGKTLFVYTDGINEAENKMQEQFGDHRLKALLQHDLGDARQTSEMVHKAVENFVGDAEPSDDLTKMCIKMK